MQITSETLSWLISLLAVLGTLWSIMKYVNNIKNQISQKVDSGIFYKKMNEQALINEKTMHCLEMLELRMEGKIKSKEHNND